MRIIPVVLAVVCGVPGLASADKVDPVTSLLGQLREAASCSDSASPLRPWCIAADFGKGAAGALPSKTLVGMTVALDGKDLANALSTKVTFVALAVDADGKVKLTDVNPSSPEDAKTVGEGVMATTLVFKGKAKTATLPKDLADYIKTLKGAYPTKKAGNAWTWQGKSSSQLRKVGAFYVVIERPSAGTGIWATILTDAWQ